MYLWERKKNWLQVWLLLKRWKYMHTAGSLQLLYVDENEKKKWWRKTLSVVGVFSNAGVCARACGLGDWDKELCVRLLAQWTDREQNSPLSNIMGFSAHPSAENTITEPLRVAFSGFSLRCFLLCSPYIPVARFKPNTHPFTQTCPHITTQHARLEGWGWQASIRPSTLM